MTENARRTFLELSADVTGFSIAELQSTGVQDTYFDCVTKIFGTKRLGELFSAWAEMKNNAAEDADDFEARFGKTLMSDSKIAPMIKNIISLWYLGQWNQMPAEWRNQYGASAHDVTHVVSGAAYREGLVWPAIGAHPMGAKQQGYASWAIAPE